MKKLFFILLYFLSPVLPIIALLWANPGKYTDSGNLFSMVLGVIAYTWLTWQFVISARPKFIEVNFGMDKIYRFHGVMAIVALVMVVAHKLIKESIFGEFFMTKIGSASMIVFIAVSAISILLMVNSKLTQLQPFKLIRKIIDSLKIFKYEHYRLLHNLTFIALILMQVHVLLASGVKSNIFVFNLFMAYFLIGLTFYFYHKIFKPWILMEKSYLVSNVKMETQDMWTISFSPKYRKVLKYKPGQFGFFKIFSDSVSAEEHPFSISSSPANKSELSITVKELGDFTKGIGKIKVGDEVIVDAPYGKFSYIAHKDEEDVVFVVGGVGITPALSMLRHMRDTNLNKKVLLIWGMNTLEDFIAKKEIEDMKQAIPNLTVVPVVAKDKNHVGETGFIEYEKLGRILKSHRLLKAETGYYLCGPVILMDNTIRNLKRLTVNKNQIHYEKFSL